MLDKCKFNLLMVEQIPLPVGHVLKADTRTVHVDVSTYCHIVGKLIFMCNARPDLSYTVGVVNRYMHSPQQAHLDSINHMLHYLNFTRDYDLLYNKDDSTSLNGFSDLDYLYCHNTLPLLVLICLC